MRIIILLKNVSTACFIYITIFFLNSFVSSDVICFVQPITTKSKTKVCIIMFFCAAFSELNRSSLWNKFCEQKLKCLHIPWLRTLNPNLGKIKPCNQNRMQSETVHTFWKYKNFNQYSFYKRFLVQCH